MRCLIKMCVVFVLCGLAGCAWFKGAGSAKTAQEQSAGMHRGISFIRDGKVLDAQRVRAGGKLLIVPFTAGVGVEADVLLDKIALMIVKGMAEVLKDEASRFEVLVSENAQEADFVIRGHVTEMNKASRIRRWIPGNREISLGIEGQMTDAGNRETLLVFTHGIKARSDQEDYQQLGYRIGKDIGRFLLSVDD